MDDIVTRLREGNGQGCKCYADYWYECACDAIWAEQYILEAADEIERLRAALALAVGELSTCGEYASMSPESLLTNFLKIADNQQLLVKEST